MPKIIHARLKCIGCGVCHEKQPEFWRMSKKDGKATLLNAKLKKDKAILSIHESDADFSRSVAADCPVRIIQVI